MAHGAIVFQSIGASMATPTGENSGKNRKKIEIAAPDKSRAIILMNERALWYNPTAFI